MIEQIQAAACLPLSHRVPKMSALARAPAHPVADVKILRDGEAAFPAMLDLIANAQRLVLFENLIFAGDATGRRFADAL